MFFIKEQPNFNTDELHTMADAVRALSVDMVQTAHSGHLGTPLGAADIITTIYANHLRFNPIAPDWDGRDRFVLSAGHASAMLYSVLHLAGYDIPIEKMMRFRTLTGLPGHPEYGIPGVETTTGPLGQGLANAVGMALGAKISEHGGNVYCMVGDGDLSEGLSEEAIAIAGKYDLDNLIVIWDNNGISIDGNAITGGDNVARFLAAGFGTIEINGMNPREIDRALTIARRMKKPVFIVAKTQIGYLSELAGTAAVHGGPLSDTDAANVLQKLRPNGDAFSVAPDAAMLWTRLRNIATGRETNGDTQKTNNVVPDILSKITASIKPESTRKIFGRAIKIAMEQMPNLIGGSADLSDSTCARPDIAHDITADDFVGNYIHYGVREHACAAIMNGLTLTGLRPYGSTFLVFSDYMRPAIRMSAIMGLPVIYVFSHDSIMVGEDGETHEPIEQLATLRLIPNLYVMRPANAAEMAVCMEMALSSKNHPTAIVTSRQDFPIVPDTATDRTDIERGAYIVRDAPGGRTQMTIIATGAGVSVALDTQKLLYNHGIAASVVSMPCVELFRAQSAEYKKKIIRGRVIALEAGASYAWYEFADFVFGIDRFGLSGRAPNVCKKLGMDAKSITDKILATLK